MVNISRVRNKARKKEKKILFNILSTKNKRWKFLDSVVLDPTLPTFDAFNSPVLSSPVRYWNGQFRFRSISGQTIARSQISSGSGWTRNGKIRIRIQVVPEILTQVGAMVKFGSTWPKTVIHLLSFLSITDVSPYAIDKRVCKIYFTPITLDSAY